MLRALPSANVWNYESMAFICVALKERPGLGLSVTGSCKHLSMSNYLLPHYNLAPIKPTPNGWCWAFGSRDVSLASRNTLMRDACFLAAHYQYFETCLTLLLQIIHAIIMKVIIMHVATT